jgi:hypothetical protein
LIFGSLHGDGEYWGNRRLSPVYKTYSDRNLCPNTSCQKPGWVLGGTFREKTPQSGIFESVKKENGIKDDVSF